MAGFQNTSSKHQSNKYNLLLQKQHHIIAEYVW